MDGAVLVAVGVGVRVRPKAAVGQAAYGIESDFVLGMADGAFCDFFFRHDSAPRTLPSPAVVSGNAGGGALVTKNIGLSYVGRGELYTAGQTEIWPHALKTRRQAAGCTVLVGYTDCTDSCFLDEPWGQNFRRRPASCL